MSARILNVKPAAYHRDPCRVPSLSQSVAHVLVDRSPMHAYTMHPRFGNQPRQGSNATDDGTLIHSLLLGKGEDRVVVLPYDEYRTNEAKAARDEVLKKGKIPIKERRLEELKKAADAIKLNLESLGYVLNGRSELAIEWDEPGADGEPVLCRCMMDHVLLEHGKIFDVKKAANASPAKCERYFTDYGYDIQYAAYTRALAALRPEFEGRIDFTFLFVELEPPYAVTDAHLEGALKTIGHLRWQRAVLRWQECLTTNKWPAYQKPGDPPVILRAKPWVLEAEEQGAYVS